MNLTNEKTPQLADQPSFSKYFQEDDKFDQYNYSDSNINDTLLLQATLLDSNNIMSQKSCSLLHVLPDNSPSISQEKSLVFDLCGELSVSSSNCGSCKTDSQEQSTKQIDDLYGICGKLVQTLSQLENKVQKIEGKESKVKQQSRDLTRNSFEQEIQSRLTYSSLQNSKSCRCEGQPQQRDQKDIIAGLFDLLQSKSKQSSYKEENQELKKQVIRLEIVNDELRRSAKKTQAQNARLKELLKQCQNFSRRLAIEKQTEESTNINRKYSHKLLSQRQFGRIKSNTSILEENGEINQMNCKMMPTQYYDHRSQQKQNIKIHSDAKHELCGTQTPPPESNHFFTHSPHQKKRPMARTFEPQIIFDPQRERQIKQSNIKIISFQQCKEESVRNSPFTRKGALKPIIENHSKSFRDLKMAKSKNSRHCI